MYLIVFAGLLASATAMYSPSDAVVELTPSNFQQRVINSDELWLVEFYAPWCGHCQSLAPEWKKAALALKGVVKVGAVNADEHQSLGGQYGVRGFPTIKIFGANKGKPEDYNGGRTAKAFVETAMAKVNSMVQDKLAGRGGSSGGGGGGPKTGSKEDVVELTDSNFKKLVLDSDVLWMVEFFAPWCGHCKNLAPHWASAATTMKGKPVKFGAYDATANSVFSSRYGVQGYPTIKMFPAGKKDGEASDYDGGRTSSDIISWVEDKLAENIEPPKVVEITSPDIITKNCEEKPLCIISFLPNILDCQSKCRNDYLNLLKSMGEKYKKKQWGYVWGEAGSQGTLEQSLGIGGFGYPAMVAVNTKKGRYVLLTGAFNEEGIHEFLRTVSAGRGIRPIPFREGTKLTDVLSIEPWDGKDGVMPVEEDTDYGDDGKDEL